MSQDDYTKQLEEENESLKRKLDEALEKYDNLYKDKDSLRNRIREIELEEMGNPVGVPTKYKITDEAYQDFKNMHGLSYKTIAEQLGMDVKEIHKFMEAYTKDE